MRDIQLPSCCNELISFSALPMISLKAVAASTGRSGSYRSSVKMLLNDGDRRLHLGERGMKRGGRSVCGDLGHGVSVQFMSFIGGWYGGFGDAYLSFLQFAFSWLYLGARLLLL